MVKRKLDLAVQSAPSKKMKVQEDPEDDPVSFSNYFSHFEDPNG
jgi:hypothetical protein